MGDLIDRQAAFEALCNATFGCADIDVCKKGDRYCAEGAKLDEVPSAQPEIIRCKNCKHLFDDNKCPLRTWWTHTEDDFCSYAEMRTDG